MESTQKNFNVTGQTYREIVESLLEMQKMASSIERGCDAISVLANPSTKEALISLANRANEMTKEFRVLYHANAQAGLQ